MDTSYINSVSKQLDWFEEYPCCKACEETDFDPLPSSLSYTELVDALPCYNPSNDPSYIPHDSLDGFYQAQANYDEFSKSRPFRAHQVKALDAFKLIHSTVTRNLGRDGVNISDIKQYAACFDAFLFNGKLLERCSIEWGTESRLDGRGGLMTYCHSCRKHQQCHAVRIHLRRHRTNSAGKALGPRTQLLRILGILLHEMSHAWVEIFGSRKYGSVSDVLEEMGPTGHGRAWKNVLRMCVWAAREHFGLAGIGESEDLGQDDDENEAISAIRRLDDFADRALMADKALGQAGFVEKISDELGIPIPHAELFGRLIDLGLNRMEALLTVWGSSAVLETKPEVDVLEVLPVHWRWK